MVEDRSSIAAYLKIFKYLPPPFITRWHGPIKHRLFGANPAVGDDARKGFPPAAIRGTTTSAGSAILKQAKPPWRPHGSNKAFSGVLDLHPSLFFIPKVWPGLRVHTFKVLNYSSGCPFQYEA